MTRKVSDTRGTRTTTSTGAGAGATAGAVATRLRPYAVPLVALAGLLIVALVSLKLFGGTIPVVGSDTNPGGDTPGDGVSVLTPGRTPSPSAPPEVNKEVTIAGSLVYEKAGNLWIQSGTTASKLTNTGRDSQPSWSADGNWIYFIETRQTKSQFPQPGGDAKGTVSPYDLHYPILTRVHPDGTGRQAILSGLYATGRYRWFYFMNTPAISPDGTDVAVCSDGPDPTTNNVVLQLVDVAHKKLSNITKSNGLPQATGSLGHQDPAWSPDGKYLLYVMNQKDDGPAIYRYTVASGKTAPLTQGGYNQPTYSADGRYIAAVKTNSIGTNVVILDGRTGAELLRVTSDGRSWGPAFSPDGSQLVFLTLASSGLTVDVHLAKLKYGTNGVPDLDGDLQALTTSSGLDGDSRPAWSSWLAAGGAAPVLPSASASGADSGSPPDTAGSPSPDPSATPSSAP
jgi:Tol biopolymer transport system component